MVILPNYELISTKIIPVHSIKKLPFFLIFLQQPVTSTDLGINRSKPCSTEKSLISVGCHPKLSNLPKALEKAATAQHSQTVIRPRILKRNFLDLQKLKNLSSYTSVLDFHLDLKRLISSGGVVGMQSEAVKNMLASYSDNIKKTFPW